MFADTTFHITTFGCQMNKHDSERIAGMMESLGCRRVESVHKADFSIFMTCCVREKADERLMGQVATMKNYPLRPNSPFKKRYIAIGGCIGQRDGERLIEQLKHVDVVFGTHNMEALPHLLEDAVEEGRSQVKLEQGRAEFHDELPEDRENAWAAWLPITVGCNNFCTYCIVPHVRGREISRPFEEIVDAAKTYVESGVKEITLLGQNVNSYGRDLYGEPRFAEVLDAVCQTGIERVRFATSHPKDISPQVIEKFATLPNLMPALHLPFQSGSDKVLKAMNRSYTKQRYLEIIDALKQACPDIALSADCIVGFPGETEEDFQETCDLVKRVGYTQVFTFIYSKREGTPAAKIDDDTPREVIQDRFDRLRTLVEDGALASNKKDEGTTTDVLFERVKTNEDGSTVATGKSPKNVTVHVPIDDARTAEDLVGTIHRVSIDRARTWYLNGTLIDGNR